MSSAAHGLAIVVWPTRLLVAIPSARTPRFRSALERRIPLLEDDRDRRGLRDCFREVMQELGVSAPGAVLALAPPLARTKSVRPPAVRHNRVEPLVRRNVGRYFPVSGPHMVGVASPIGAGWHHSVEAVVAGCAPQTVVDPILSASREAGIRIHSVVPATVALVEGLRRVRRFPSSDRHAVLVRSGGWREAILVEGGRLSRVLPLRGWGTANGESGARGEVEVIEVGEAGEADPCADWHAVRGVVREREEKLACVDDPEPGSFSPGLLAALGAIRGLARLPRLRSEEVARRERRQDRRRTAALALGAIVLLLSAALIHLWGLSRELRAVEEQRGRIATVVTRAAQARAAVGSVVETLEDLDSLRGDRPDPVRMIRAVAEALPADAHLHLLRMNGDTLRLEGVGLASGQVTAALEKATSVVTASPDLGSHPASDDSDFRIRVLMSDAPPVGGEEGEEGS